MASLFIYFVQYMHASPAYMHFQHLVSCCVFYLVVFEFQVIVVANDDDGETSHRTQLDFEFKVNYDLTKAFVFGVKRIRNYALYRLPIRLYKLYQRLSIRKIRHSLKSSVKPG